MFLKLGQCVIVVGVAGSEAVDIAVGVAVDLAVSVAVIVVAIVVRGGVTVGVAVDRAVRVMTESTLLAARSCGYAESPLLEVFECMTARRR